MPKRLGRDLLAFTLGAGLVLWINYDGNAKRTIIIFVVSTLAGAALSMIIRAVGKYINAEH